MKRNKQYILLLITATLILVSGCKTARKATSGREGIFKENPIKIKYLKEEDGGKEPFTNDELNTIFNKK